MPCVSIKEYHWLESNGSFFYYVKKFITFTWNRVAPCIHIFHIFYWNFSSAAMRRVHFLVRGYSSSIRLSLIITMMVYLPSFSILPIAVVLRFVYIRYYSHAYIKKWKHLLVWNKNTKTVKYFKFRLTNTL